MSKPIEIKHSKNEQLFNAIESGVGYSSDKTLAKYFDASRSTIWHWTRTGRLPSPIKITDGSTRWSNNAIKQHQRVLEQSHGRVKEATV
jgi:predicted DNA-binding transcriptional regulator AlpA